MFLEKARKIYYIILMQDIKEREQCFRELLTEEEFRVYSKIIIENNKKLMNKKLTTKEFCKYSNEIIENNKKLMLKSNY